jgi:hypothetical protein
MWKYSAHFYKVLDLTIAGSPLMVSHVGTRKAIVSWTLLTVAVAGLAYLYSQRSGEPVYQGKPLTSWLEQYGTNHWSGNHRDLEQEAKAALQHIGTNAMPIYLQMMTARESLLRVKLLTLAQKPWLAPFHITSVVEYRRQLDLRKTLGSYGFVALGAEAKPFVSALIALNNATDQRTRYLAIFALSRLGPAASEALPEMIECLNDPDMTIRCEAATGLGEIHQEPEKSVRILRDFIEKYRTDRNNMFASEDAIWSLGEFGAHAKPAVQMLLGLLNDPQEGVRNAATNALKNIDLEAATKAGVK